MYDPEIALKRELDLYHDELLLERVIQRFGIDDPWTKRVELVTSIFITISQKENDLDNCFDLDEQSDIENQIDELISIARDALALP